jgi:hypothetical protein
LHGVHLRCGLPARRTAEAVRCLDGFDGFITPAAAPKLPDGATSFRVGVVPAEDPSLSLAHYYGNPVIAEILT